MPNVEIIAQSKNSYQIKGNLIFDSIKQSIIDALNFPNNIQTVTIDLQELSKIDSAGLALLIEWKKLAQIQQITLQFKHIPAQLKALVKLSYISENDLFTIKNTEHDG